MNDGQIIACCKSVTSSLARRVDDSLIERMVVTDYYDGPLGGFIQCPACNAEYHFVTLDWSRDQFVRVISLAEVPPGTFERLTDFFGEAPAWKKWIPKLLSRATEEELDRIEPFVANLASQAEEPSIVLAWNVFTNHVLAARRPDSSVSGYLTALLDTPQARRKDWFAYLGLSRSEGLSQVSPTGPSVDEPAREELPRTIAESQPDHQWQTDSAATECQEEQSRWKE